MVDSWKFFVGSYPFLLRFLLMAPANSSGLASDEEIPFFCPAWAIYSAINLVFQFLIFFNGTFLNSSSGDFFTPNGLLGQ